MRPTYNFERPDYGLRRKTQTQKGLPRLARQPLSIFSDPRFAKQRLEDQLCAEITGASVG